MPFLWVMLWSALPPLAQSSALDRCGFDGNSSLQTESPLLKSLQCYNDYMFYVHCEWNDSGNSTLQLWFKTDIGREQCVPYNVAAQDAGEHRTAQCRYPTRALAIGIQHNVFFLGKKDSLCSSVPHKPLKLSQHLRARPPVDLSTHDAGDGGRRLSWSSPYPSSSSLNRNIMYQLSYRTDTEDSWTTKVVTKTSVKLEKQMLLPGRRYEARVRARVSGAQWSLWSPVVTWQTEEEDGQSPSLHCVLDGETEVMCSWEVSRELAHFITYQLACRPNQAAEPVSCCVNSTVTPDLSGTMLKYSCSLTGTDLAHLQLEFLPARNGKIFEANKHIRPDPPQKVSVKNEGGNWFVEWTAPNIASRLLSKLFYELCYYKIQDLECSIQNISLGSMSLTIMESLLEPSQHYQVKVRSLVSPGDKSIYGGIPSEWTDPVDWTSNEATWSPATLIYLSISVIVATIFFTLYCTIPACHRRVILWVDSVPSPGKSKILSEIKSANSRTYIQGENSSVCKVQDMDSISTCSSDITLWSTKYSEKKHLEQDEGCWNCDNLPSPSEKVNSTDTSSMSFSGPYIFCQTSQAGCRSLDINCQEKETETRSDDSASPSPGNNALYGEGYVCLPSFSASRSTQDLVSHCEADTNTHCRDTAEQDQQRPDKTEVQPGDSEPTVSHQPPPYFSGPYPPWPQGVTIQPSGYCHIPTAHMSTEK